MQGNILLIIPILLPFLIGLIIAAWKSISIRAAQLLVAGSSLVNLLILLWVVQQGADLTLLRISNTLSISFSVDEVGLLFLTLVSIIWVLASFYAVEYMSHEVNVIRFYIFWIITLGAMVGIGLSSNLFTFYMFYEFMTLSSYPLVINQGTQAAKKAGIQYLAYSLIGAGLTLIAIMIVNGVAGTNDFVHGGFMSQFIDSDIQPILITAYFVAVVGYGAKAGLYPMHAWLPKAHPVAPAPASALLSGIITKAGVLGIIRMTYYIFGIEILAGSWAQKAAIVLILLTIFLGSMLAYRANQLKVRLAYSSVSQVAYVLLGLMLFNETALAGGVLQVLSHAMIKNLLFMVVGAIIFKTGKTYVEEINGEGRTMPITMIAFTIGSLSLIGIPPLSGFVSKYYLAMGSLGYSNNVVGILGVVILIISSMLTAGYLIPIIIKAFFPGKDEDPNVVNPEIGSHEPSSWMTVPFIILTLGIIVLGVYPQPVIEYITAFVAQLM